MVPETIPVIVSVQVLLWKWESGLGLQFGPILETISITLSKNPVSSTLGKLARTNLSGYNNSLAVGSNTPTFIVASTTRTGKSVVNPVFFTFHDRNNCQ